MTRVSSEDLATAQAWLRCNEGDGGEADACTRVADWICREIDNRSVRSVAKSIGVSAAKVRAVITDAESAS